MRFRHTVMLLTLLCAAGPALAAGQKPPGLLLVETESRIEVDSSGKVLSIKTTPELPADVEAAVADNLRKLRFAPPMLDGKPVAGVTYARQDACAAPVDGAYRFAVKFRGNGPSLANRVAPAFPGEPMRAGVSSDWAVTYAIDRDGKATLVEAVRKSGGGNRFDQGFRAALGQWVSALRFQPEQLDGKPVSTRMSTNVRFVARVTRPAATKLARVAGNDACQLAIAARDDEDRHIALNSPFALLPAN